MQAAVPARQAEQASTKAATALLLSATFLVFSPTLGAPFHLDDVTLFSNPVVTSPSGWWHVWRPLQTRPLTYFTFWVNFQTGGENALGYHAVNVVLHIAATWLLQRLMLRLAGVKPAFIAATLFALHPVQTEPVAYIFERATLLATVFCLLSAHSWLDGRYPRSIGLFIFALLSKEECVTFPIFLLLIRAAIAPAVWMLCLSLAAGARVLLALELLDVSGAGRHAGLSALDYLSTQGVVILRYFRLMLVPFGFTCDPDIPIVRDWRGWAAWAALVAIAAVIWRLHAHGKWFVAGLILLAPSSSIFPAEDLSADRRLYLPMVAFAGFAGLSLQALSPRAALIPAAIGLAALCANRSLVWRSEERLWAEAAERAPKKVRPQIFLSRAAGLDAALGILEAVHTQAPHDPRPLVEKGLRLLAVNRPERAAWELQRALELAPDDAPALNNYGAALAMLGKREAAIEQFRHALRLDPCSTTPRKNLALLGITDVLPCP